MRALTPFTTHFSVVALTTLTWIGVSNYTPVQAIDLTFTGVASGQWGLPTNATASTQLSNQAGGSNNRLEWGRTDNCPTCTPFNNYVQYDSQSFVATAGQLFNLGNLTYRNGSTWDEFNGDFALTVSLALNTPLAATEQFNFLFNILNTPNLTGNPVLDADILRFSVVNLPSQTFQYDGVSYTLQLVGFSSDNGKTLLSEFKSPEGSTAAASLYGEITSTTPAPPNNSCSF